MWLEPGERSLKGSWKLTFVAWSALLLVWSVVTVALDHDSLRLVRRLGGERTDLASVLVALVIGLPLCIDVTRNVQRTYRLWKRRAQNDGDGATWDARVPAMTPRRFLVAGDLTRRERTIVEQGQLAYGVVEHHGELTSVRFSTPWGRDVASRPVVVAGERPRDGARSPLLFEPGAKVGVAPQLHDVTFFGAPPLDRRLALEAVSPMPADGRLTLATHATLHPVHRVSGAKPTEVGELTFDGDKLSLLQGDSEPSTLRLSQPFRVELSVHLLPAGQAELNLSLEQRTHSAYRAGDPKPLRLKTELPQSRIDRRLALGWEDATYLRPEDFDALWAVVVAHADDDALTASVAPA